MNFRKSSPICTTICRFLRCRIILLKYTCLIRLLALPWMVLSSGTEQAGGALRCSQASAGVLPTLDRESYQREGRESDQPSSVLCPPSTSHLPFSHSTALIAIFEMCRKDLAKQKIALESSAELSGGKCTNPGVGGRHRHGKRILQSSIRPQMLHGSIIKYARITST